MYFFLIRIVMYGFIETTKETIDYNRIEKGECLELLEPLFIDRKSKRRKKIKILRKTKSLCK